LEVKVFSIAKAAAGWSMGTMWPASNTCKKVRLPPPLRAEAVRTRPPTVAAVNHINIVADMDGLMDGWMGPTRRRFVRLVHPLVVCFRVEVSLARPRELQGPGLVANPAEYI